jgi:hypothetical protein
MIEDVDIVCVFTAFLSLAMPGTKTRVLSEELLTVITFYGFLARLHWYLLIE